MCGIVGALTKYNNGFNQGALSAFSDLLYMDTLRGVDSTGVFLIDSDGTTRVMKDAVPSWEFLTKEYDGFIDKPGFKTGKALVGHNRKATMGKLNPGNAHPFVVNEEFVLVHNGSLTTHKHLGDAEVDSNAIAQYLHDKWKEEDTPEEKAKVLAHIGGAWALVWHDMRTNVLNIVRNGQRPLALVETASEFFFASEEAMLLAGLSRNSLTPTQTYKVEPFVVYTINLEEASPKVMEVVLPTSAFFPTPQPGGSTKTKQASHSYEALEEDTALSKSAFKRFLKTVIGREIKVYVDDFVPLKVDSTEFYFYGSCWDFTFQHEIVGVSSPDMTLQVQDNYNSAVAKVSEATYDKESKKVQLVVELTGIDNFTNPLAH